MRRRIIALGQKNERGTFKAGCLIFIAIVFIILLVVAIAFFNLPQRIGIVSSPAERLLSATPDREASQALTSDLQQLGFNTQGVELHVIPKKNSEENILYAELDSSEGFNINQFGSGGDPVTDALTILTNLDESGENDIERIAINYRDENGDSLATMTASTAVIRGFANGTVSRQEFMQELEGEVELSKLIEEIMQ